MAKQNRKRRPKLRVVGGKKDTTVRLSQIEKRYFTALHQFIDTMYAVASDEYEWTWSKFAAAAQVCPATVANLGNRVTRYPQYLTIYKLAAAVGMELKLAKIPGAKKAAAGHFKVAAG